ncbi:hypothetical protein R1flu_011587 [Riccia fluitans]|uniref:Secreted protein n=1 Tax=Riccia fluitans TaxID=41844 RepID=A0ABD1Z937_9MARC
MGIAVRDMTKLCALVLDMTALSTTLAGVSGFLRLPVPPHRRSSLPIKSSLNFLGTLIQLDHGATPWLVLQTAGIIDIGLQVPQEKQSNQRRVGFFRWQSFRFSSEPVDVDQHRFPFLVLHFCQIVHHHDEIYGSPIPRDEFILQLRPASHPFLV